MQHSGMENCICTCSAKLAKLGPEEPRAGPKCKFRVAKLNLYPFCKTLQDGHEEAQEGFRYNIRAWKVAIGPVLQNSTRLSPRSLKKGLNSTSRFGKANLDLPCKTRQDAPHAASRSHGKTRQDWPRGASRRAEMQHLGLES